MQESQTTSKGLNSNHSRKTKGLSLTSSSKIHLDSDTQASLCASYQEAIVDVLMCKLKNAVKKYEVKKVIISGGVSANSRLRYCAESWAKKENLQLAIPPLRYCTDNGAMVGYVGVQHLKKTTSHKIQKVLRPHLIQMISTKNRSAYFYSKH